MQRVRAAPTAAVGTLFFWGGIKGKVSKRGKAAGSSRQERHEP